MNKYLKTLELDKILNMLADLTSNEDSRKLALSIEPENDLERVKYETLKTSQALNLSIQFGTPAFTGFKNICSQVNHAKSGAVISLRDLLDVADMLRQINLCMIGITIALTLRQNSVTFFHVLCQTTIFSKNLNVQFFLRTKYQMRQALNYLQSDAK